MSSVLVIDVGTTGLRAAIVDDHLAIRAIEHRRCAPSTPAPGLVEFDATVMAAALLDAARAVLASTPDPVVAVGITSQRASTVIWDRRTGEPIAPGLGWQDLRTVGECITATAEHGWALAPNQSITKMAWLLDQSAGSRRQDLCIGTVDSWIAWVLSEGRSHVTDQTNASTTTTGLRTVDATSWDTERCAAFDIPVSMLAEVHDSVSSFGAATALPGAPPITAIVGDQQAAVIGTGCTRAGRAKITFGTGGMLDLCTEQDPPTVAQRNDAGTYPLPLWSLDDEITWGVEGIMLSAGTNIEWLRDDLQLIATSAQSHDVAARCDDTGGVVYVPALLGLGTPQWDYGARGALLGLTRGTERCHVVRAVLEGVAHRGADLLDAARVDSGIDVDTVRVDGGMSQNATFVQTLANATGCAVEVAPIADTTTLGAAFLAGLGAGMWSGLDDLESLWHPAAVVAPDGTWDRGERRRQWRNAVARAADWIPELSALDF